MDGGSWLRELTCCSAITDKAVEAISPQAYDGLAAGSRMPYGTIQGFRKDIERGILISIQHDAAPCTNVRSHAQTLLHDGSTGTTRLRGVLWRYRDDRNVVQHSIILDPGNEFAPACV